MIPIYNDAKWMSSKPIATTKLGILLAKLRVVRPNGGQRDSPARLALVIARLHGLLRRLGKEPRAGQAVRFRISIDRR